MSESYAKPRAAPGAMDGRPRSAVPQGREEALAELARLVGRDDPFKGASPAGKGSPRAATGYAPAPRIDTHQDGYEQGADDAYGNPDGDFGYEPRHDHDLQDLDARFRGTLHAPQAPPYEVQDPLTRRESLRFPALPNHDIDFGGPHDQQLDTDPRRMPPPLNADLWAEGVTDGQPDPALGYDVDAGMADPAERGRSNRRTLIVLAAVVALTAGGLGATFLVRGHSAVSADASGTPTIMAATGPSKIQPENTGGTGPTDGSTALLEKAGSDNVQNARVVSDGERPIDLSQLPKTAAGADGRAPSNGGSPFPEPKKVKTVLIRPDGSVVGEEATKSQVASTVGVTMPPAVTGEAPAVTNAADGASPPLPPAAPVARPATPKTTARVTTTPKTNTPSDGTPAPKPRPGKTKPVETADAAPTVDSTATTASTGSYAVQLAAPASEQDAKDVSARLQKKFVDQLGGRKPSIHKADSGDKSVYRVRVGNLSQDDAKSLCSKLQSNGGSCFVVRN